MIDILKYTSTFCIMLSWFCFTQYVNAVKPKADYLLAFDLLVNIICTLIIAYMWLE